MELLSKYTNGNYTVELYSDGTKVRTTPDGENPKSEFPENIDIKLTNKCNAGCAWCHENSTPQGKTANLNHEFIKTLRPGTELACGGGNILEMDFDELTEFFKRLKKQGVFPSITVNQIHLNPKIYQDNIDKINFWLSEDLIKGVGVSYSGDLEQLKEIKKRCSDVFNERMVIHTINGIQNYEELKKLSKVSSKILLLGYKTFRRGESYRETYSDIIKENQSSVYKNIHELISLFEVMSFDNLAIEQVNLRRIFLKDEWEKFYMGDEGNFTMYIDLVEEKFAKNSFSAERFDLKDDVKDMFSVVNS